MNLLFPNDLFSLTWFLIGFSFARGFGKRLDNDIQNSEWFKRRNPIMKGFLKRLLDSLHHYWAGLLLMLYAPGPEAYWFGLGLFIDDLPDIPRRYRILFSHYGKEVSKSGN